MTSFDAPRAWFTTKKELLDSTYPSFTMGDTAYPKPSVETLRKDIKDWLDIFCHGQYAIEMKEHCSSMLLGGKPFDVVIWEPAIIFDSTRDAALFKLTWM